MGRIETIMGDIEFPTPDAVIEELFQSLEEFQSQDAKEKFCLQLQWMQPGFIERNKRLMKTNMIEFDEYEEVK